MRALPRLLRPAATAALLRPGAAGLGVGLRISSTAPGCWRSFRAAGAPSKSLCGGRLAAPPLRALHASAPAANVVQFKLSDIGEGIKEVTVKEWFVGVGDKVAQFDQICEVQSDKASVTITSRFDGVITKLYYEERVDDIAQTGDPLVDIETEGSAEPAPELTVEAKRSKVGDAGAIGADGAGGAGGGEKVLATPAVRHMAAKHKIDLAKVSGSGKEGRVLKDDLLKYLNQSTPATRPAEPAAAEAPTRKAAPAAAAAPASAPASPPPPSRRPPPPVSVAVAGAEKDQVQPFDAFTRAMYKKMSEALSIPHFAYKDEIDMTQLTELRARLKKEYPDLKLSYMPFLVKATSLALLSHPRLNASVDGQKETLTLHGRHHIGVAMDTEHGLIVPNVKDVQRLSVLEIAEEMLRLADLGRRGKLGEDDLKGGTFTLSNIGSIGGTYAMPVIMPPQIFIGALGKTQLLPRYLDDGQTLVPRRIMNVSWSADHRVLDGATVARFSNQWKSYLEEPDLMLLSLK